MGRKPETITLRTGIAILETSREIETEKCIHIREGVIESIESTASCPRNTLGGEEILAITPPGIAHTHSLDHAFPEYGYTRNIEELVKPPEGIKHKLIEKLTDKEAIQYTLEYYRLAWTQGIGLLLDYREKGGWGCLTAKKALEKAPEDLRVVVLGRPGPLWPMGCDALGLNSPLDYPLEELKSLVSRFRPASAHVAETREMREKGDLEKAIEAGFDFIIHGTHLSPSDLELLRENNIGLVVCPQSNMWHSTGLPPVKDALNLGILLGIGVDNAAWEPPDPWNTGSLLLYIARLQGDRNPNTPYIVLSSLLDAPYKLAGVNPPVITEGSPPRILIYNIQDTGIRRAREKYSAIVKRLRVSRLIARIDPEGISWP